jgi:hypothetical protein
MTRPNATPPRRPVRRDSVGHTLVPVVLASVLWVLLVLGWLALTT